jgi:hypothetical protein
MKLPDIQRSQAARSQMISPAAEVGSNSAKYNAYSNTLTALGTVADKYKEDAAGLATASHRQVGVDTLKFTAENETLTWDELEQLGIADQIEAENVDGSPIEDVPRHLWSATLLQSELETSREIYSQTLPSSKERAAWDRDMAGVDGRAVLSSVGASAEEAQRRMATQLDNHRKAAIEQGDWDKVEHMQNMDIYKDVYASSPGLRELQKLEVAQGREYDGFNTMMVQGEYDEVMDMAADADRNTALSSDDLRKVYFAAQVAQDKEETGTLKLERQWKENNYIDARANIAADEMSLQQVLDTRNNYTPAHLSQLITAAQNQIDDSTKVDGATAQASENTINTELELATRGVYPDTADTLEEYQAQVRSTIDNGMTRYAKDGSLIPGLSPTVARRLRQEVTDLPEIPYVSPPYKRLVSEMKLRVLRTTDDGPSWLPATDSAQLMAGALDSLHSYMDNETRNGRVPDLDKWEEENMPRYMSKSAKAAFINLPDDIQAQAVYTSGKNGGKFALDYDATIKSLTASKAAALVNNPNADMTRIDAKIAKFGEYWEAYGEYAGSK